jgi:hypothetical protein
MRKDIQEFLKALAGTLTSGEAAKELGVDEEEFLSPDTSTGMNNLLEAVGGYDSVIERARALLGAEQPTELVLIQKEESPYNREAVGVFAYFSGKATKDDLREAGKQCTGSNYVGMDPDEIAENAERIENTVVNEDLECWFLGHAC